MEYKVNIVISTYNRLGITKQSLPSIIDLASDSIPHMISIIDNGSTDGTPEYLQQLFNEKKITNLILHPVNLGVAKAHNIFWSMFSDKVPIYGKVDNDLVFKEKNWLDSIINVLDKCPSVGIAGHSVENIEGVYKEFPIVEENGVKYRFKNDNLGGACVFFPKRIREEFGYWNESYGLYGEEDTDYGYRIRISGLKNAYMVKYVAYHINDINNNSYLQFKNDERRKNTSGRFWTNLRRYDTDKSSRKINTNILNEVKYNLQTNME